MADWMPLKCTWDTSVADRGSTAVPRMPQWLVAVAWLIAAGGVSTRPSTSFRAPPAA
eukprot:CAMPEP_0179456566 /NCGR_PEP_ID=MMETSP0799-20121207/40423_1 /TAXON_ID=46947 /ORGANISM="Geminigera cryophila, Strain CCMP2564" /LENGTH=56 /DNA_ID=CAMNT_0021256559 /DNA_START=456 /DNA_END=623 /DNA_ORIENTATION=-